MKLTSESKFFIGIIAGTIALVVIAVAFMSQPAKPLPREMLLPATTQTKGNASASAYLVEFSDFQCPACLAAKPYVDDVVAKYGDNLAFGYRHFPLMQHPYGEKAAIAAEAAAAQGKFWDMYGLLFLNQTSLSDELVASFAAQLNLDIDAFTRATTDSATRQKVLDDTAYAASIGVNSTPTFYLNGQKLNINTFAQLEDEVKKAIGQ